MYSPTTFESLPRETRQEILEQLPRASKTSLLQVSKLWSTEVAGHTHLWTNLVFGPRSVETDLLVASKWIDRSGSLPLSFTICQAAGGSRDVSPANIGLVSLLDSVTTISNRLGKLHIQVPYIHAQYIHNFLTSLDFSNLHTLTILLEPHWTDIIRHGVSETATLEDTDLPAFHTSYDLPFLRHLQLSHFPSFVPPLPTGARGTRLTEILLGPVGSVKPDIEELKQALESAPGLQRLGFHGEIVGLSLNDFQLATTVISLPSLTTLSFSHTPPSILYPFVSTLDIPNFTSLVIALKHSNTLSGDDHPSELIAALHTPLIAARLRSLTIQALAYPCDSFFYSPFTALETLSLDFSGLLSSNYWTALAMGGGEESLATLRNLRLVNIHPAQAQEIVLLRSEADQPPLHSLDLLLFEVALVDGRSRCWTAWLERNVGTLTLYNIIDAQTHRHNQSFFEL
ncbi:hypothetical protein R3P38DRAFT_3276466 [Favolaschia claudopus]|uniref:F-box domain-containing protein n=1 Tax=Favolaschia claudopus TaxID=2862362 RepID=A0AAW0ARX4_9AGAR